MQPGGNYRTLQLLSRPVYWLNLSKGLLSLIEASLWIFIASYQATLPKEGLNLLNQAFLDTLRWFVGLASKALITSDRRSGTNRGHSKAGEAANAASGAGAGAGAAPAQRWFQYVSISV